MPKGIMDAPDGGGGGNRNGIWHLRLRDEGESARVRFLTDADEMYFEWFHKVNVPGRKMPDMKICLRSALDQECVLCDQGVKSAYDWLAWVYVYTQNYHEKKDGRTAVQVGRTTFYQEQVNEARLIRMSMMHKGAVKVKYERLGTLLDHEFEWVRSGAAGNTRPTYSLEILEKSPMPRELAELSGKLPDLEDIAFDRVEDTSGIGRSAPSTQGQPAAKAKTKTTRVAVVEEEQEFKTVDKDLPDEDPFA